MTATTTYTTYRTLESKFVVMRWYVPGGCDYHLAEMQSYFFTTKEDAEKYQAEWCMPPEMASLHELNTPSADKAWPKPTTCRHCNAIIHCTRDSWVNLEEPILRGYCWVDPEQGSQRHEPSF